MTTILDDLLDRISDRVTDDVVPGLISGLSEAEQAQIRAAVVERVIANVRAGKSETMRRLVERAEGEVWNALRTHPAVLEAVQTAANGMSAAAVAAVNESAPKLATRFVENLKTFLIRGH